LVEKEQKVVRISHARIDEKIAGYMKEHCYENA
jgi:hypothetical protein